MTAYNPLENEPLSESEVAYCETFAFHRRCIAELLTDFSRSYPNADVWPEEKDAALDKLINELKELEEAWGSLAPTQRFAQGWELEGSYREQLRSSLGTWLEGKHAGDHALMAEGRARYVITVRVAESLALRENIRVVEWIKNMWGTYQSPTGEGGEGEK